MADAAKRTAEINIAYIGGGSKGWAWGLMSDLASDGQLSGNVRLYDIDAEAAKSNEIIGNNIKKAAGRWRYQAVGSLREALTGANFVVISILPATFKEMESDVHEPEKFGILQPVGDTTGPGGLVRALRTIPMYIEIAEAVKQFSPEAWVISYTNPMTLCVRTLYETFPQIKAFGCCHEVFGTQKLLCDALAEIRGIENAAREDIKVNVLGINHFTWIDEASYQGLDLIPVYKQFCEKYYEEGYSAGGDKNWMNDYFSSAQRVKFDLFMRYGVIAAAGDRHLAEFCPPWYLRDRETVSAWKFSLTPVSWRVGHKAELEEKARKLVAGELEFELKKTGEEGVSQIKALLGLGDIITNVNIPNYGQMEGVPFGSVVETNAYFGYNTIRPMHAGSLPVEVHSLVIRHVYNQETVLRAAFTLDCETAFRAFINDPLVCLSLSDARKLFDTMLANTAQYLKFN